MKKHITIGAENFTIIIIKTTVVEDAYSDTVADSHTWIVKVMQGSVLLNSDKTRVENSVIQLVRNAHDFIDKAACKTDPGKTLEQKLSDMGFN